MVKDVQFMTFAHNNRVTDLVKLCKTSTIFLWVYSMANSAMKWYEYLCEDIKDGQLIEAQ